MARKQTKTFETPSRVIPNFFRLIRIHQWVKNLLIATPLLAAHKFDDAQLVIVLFIAFISFCLCSSAVYVINDLLDVASDRAHPQKRNRPFASGFFPTALGVLIAPILFGTSMAIGLMVNRSFLIWVILYFILASLYSLLLKKFSPLDCLALAFLYTIRLGAGAAAVDVPLSFWLLSFSLFLFLSLANLKRFAELILQSSHGQTSLTGRNYHADDLPIVRTLGVSSGFTASLVLALYIQGESVVVLYESPVWIWAVVPLILFWISWLWTKAQRSEMEDDPLAFAINDKVSIFIGFMIVTCFILASSSLSVS